MAEVFLITLALLLAVALSFVLSGMEAGLPLLSRIRIRHLCRQKRASARILQGFLDRPDEFLWTILVGNTLANLGLLCGVVFLLHRGLSGRLGLVFGLLALVAFLLYAVADLLPKMLFRKFPNRLCLALARPFRLIHLVLRPAVAAVAWSANAMLQLTGGSRFKDRLFGSREELQVLMQESAQGLTTEEVAMVNRVLDLQSRTVGTLMQPLSRVITIPAELPTGEFLRLCQGSGGERLPVRGADPARILGVMSLRSALYRQDLDPARPVRDYMAAPFQLDPSLRLEEALKKFQRSGHRLAIATGRDGEAVGVVTLGDILRFLFGEVHL